MEFLTHSKVIPYCNLLFETLEEVKERKKGGGSGEGKTGRKEVHLL